MTSSNTSLKVYVPDDEFVWVRAEVFPSTDDRIPEIEVLITGDDYFSDDDSQSVPTKPVPAGRKKINVAKVLRPLGLSSLPLQNENVPIDGVEDMVSLGYLHEGSILDNLKRRFLHKLPYTYTGPICIAVNPYKWLNNYTRELRENYTKHYKYELTPHVYSTSAHAFRGISERRRNQSILVSGESGAGKTETVKILMGHIADMTSKHDDTLITKVLEANPLLESFGNAKTIRNDNSSRFGKFIELQFDELSKLVGSKCFTYLLEKTRVVFQNPQERNFHVIYQLLAAPDNITTPLFLKGKTASYFSYTCSGDVKTNTIEGITDAKHFQQTMSELSLLGIDGKLQLWLQQSLAGMLFLGQVRVTAIVGQEFSNPDNAMISLEGVDTKTNLKACCALLGVSMEDFSKAITSRTIEVRGQELAVPLKIDQALSSRDALAKEIYARVFQWLVHVINYNTTDKLADHSYGILRTIGLLDIFGFETFSLNRFEQFMINYANEKLQQKFTEDVFKTVQQEYRDEGLDWQNIYFNDNVEVLDLIESKRGILACLNEEYLIPKSSDATLLSKMKTNCASYTSFYTSLKNRDQFTVTHYAGAVSYTVNGFLDRNKDTLPEDLRALLAKSSNTLIATLFSEAAGYGLFSITDEVPSLPRDILHSFLLLDHKTNQDPVKRAEMLNDVLEGNLMDRRQRRGSSASELKRQNSSSETKRKDSNADKNIPTRPTNFRRKSSFIVADTVTTKFKRQLSNLLDNISVTETQYVRCFKPNANKSSKEFNPRMIIEQLRSSGVIEAISVARAAYPNSIDHEEFVARFRVLREQGLSRSSKNRAFQVPMEYTSPRGNSLALKCKAILDMVVAMGRLNPKDLPVPPGGRKGLLYEIGKNKVYFALGVQERLEILRAEAMLTDVTVIQKVFRGYRQYKKYQRIRKACIYLQNLVRMMKDRIQYVTIRRAAIAIQCFYRRVCLKDKLEIRRVRRSAAVLITSLAKMRYQRKRYIKIRDKEREIAEMRRQFAINKKKLNEEAATRKILEAEVKRLTIENSELQQGRVSPRTGPASDDVEILRKQLKSSTDAVGSLKNMVLALEGELVKDKEALAQINKSKSDLDKELAAVAAERAEINRLRKELQTEKAQLQKMVVLMEKLPGSPESPVAKPLPDATPATYRDILRRLESPQGLPARIYNQLSYDGPNSPSKKSKIRAVMTSIRKTSEFDTIYIEFTIGAANETSFEDSVKFSVRDLLNVSPGKGVTLNIPDSVSADLCMSLNVEGFNEINFVLASLEVRDFAVEILSDLIKEHSLESLESEDLRSVTSFSTPTRRRPSIDKSNSAKSPQSRSTRESFLTPGQNSTWKEVGSNPGNKDWESPVGQYMHTPLPTKVTIVMRGWAAKQDNHSWTRRFLILEKETRQIKYGSSDAILLGFSNHIRGVLQLEKDMKCTSVRGGGTFLSARTGMVIEVTGPRSGVILRMQVENEKEGEQWKKEIIACINSYDEYDSEAIAASVAATVAALALKPTPSSGSSRMGSRRPSFSGSIN